MKDRLEIVSREGITTFNLWYQWEQNGRCAILVRYQRYWHMMKVLKYYVVNYIFDKLQWSCGLRRRSAAA
jgi:hypothetical protein